MKKAEKEAPTRARTNAPIRCSGGVGHSFIHYTRYLALDRLPHDSAHPSAHMLVHALAFRFLFLPILIFCESGGFPSFFLS